MTVGVFLILHLVPGDPAIAIAGSDARPDMIAAIRTEVGLEEPLSVQYGLWLGRVLQGDLGRLYIKKLSVAEQIGQRIPATLGLTFAGLPTQEVARLKQNANIKLFQTPVRVMYDILLQSPKPPFDNKLLRQAINWAIDRERFVWTILADLSVPSSQPFPAHSWAHFPALDKAAYTFNLDKAKDAWRVAGRIAAAHGHTARVRA